MLKESKRFAASEPEVSIAAGGMDPEDEKLLDEAVLNEWSVVEMILPRKVFISLPFFV